MSTSLTMSPFKGIRKQLARDTTKTPFLVAPSRLMQRRDCFQDLNRTIKDLDAKNHFTLDDGVVILFVHWPGYMPFYQKLGQRSAYNYTPEQIKDEIFRFFMLFENNAILDNTYDWSRSNVRLLLAKDAPTYHTGVHISRDFVEVESIKMGTVNIHGSDYTMWRPDIVIRLSY